MLVFNPRLDPLSDGIPTSEEQKRTLARAREALQEIVQEAPGPNEGHLFFNLRRAWRGLTPEEQRLTAEIAIRWLPTARDEHGEAAKGLEVLSLAGEEVTPEAGALLLELATTLRDSQNRAGALEALGSFPSIRDQSYPLLIGAYRSYVEANNREQQIATGGAHLAYSSLEGLVRLTPHLLEDQRQEVLALALQCLKNTGEKDYPKELSVLSESSYYSADPRIQALLVEKVEARRIHLVHACQHLPDAVLHPLLDWWLEDTRKRWQEPQWEPVLYMLSQSSGHLLSQTAVLRLCTHPKPEIRLLAITLSSQLAGVQEGSPKAEAHSAEPTRFRRGR